MKWNEFNPFKYLIESNIKKIRESGFIYQNHDDVLKNFQLLCFGIKLPCFLDKIL